MSLKGLLDHDMPHSNSGTNVFKENVASMCSVTYSNPCESAEYSGQTSFTKMRDNEQRCNI
jgi:hypothetical protein